MEGLVDALCSDRCAGRQTGSEGGRLARGLVVDALRSADCDPSEQALDRVRGANVLATIPGEIDRWILVGAHYDHLGKDGPRSSLLADGTLPIPRRAELDMLVEGLETGLA